MGSWRWSLEIWGHKFEMKGVIRTLCFPPTHIQLFKCMQVCIDIKLGLAGVDILPDENHVRTNMAMGLKVYAVRQLQWWNTQSKLDEEGKDMRTFWTKKKKKGFAIFVGSLSYQSWCLECVRQTVRWWWENRVLGLGFLLLISKSKLTKEVHGCCRLNRNKSGVHGSVRKECWMGCIFMVFNPGCA